MIVTKESLEADLAQSFPLHIQRLLPLCLVGSRPLGGAHVEYLDALVAPRLPVALLSSLAHAYVYLAAAFFCIDHVYDGDPHDSFEVLAPATLVARAIGSITIVAAEFKIPSLALDEKLMEIFSTFNESMIREKTVSIASNKYWSDVYDHVTGRSALFVVYFKILNLLKSRPDEEAELELLRQFIYFMQLGDDLGDWRSDFKVGKITPVLAMAFEQASRPFSTEDELEEFVYLSGFYERTATNIADGLQQVRDRLAVVFQADVSGLRAYIDRQIDRVRLVASNFAAVKAGREPLPTPTDN